MKRVAIITILFLLIAASAFAGSYEDGVKAFGNKDYKTAFGIFSKLAAKGDVQAQSTLGFMYDAGIGVPQDYTLAYMWWNLAAAGGNKDAVNNRDIVAKKMTPAQIDKAQEMSRDWKAKTTK